MFVVIALGNPGEKYTKTRHNVGWLLVEEITKDLDCEYNKYANAEMVTTKIGDQEVLLVKPQTFMNKSGETLAYLLKEHDLSSDRWCVVHDDIDLPLGTIKISHDRGDGGHNGLRSLIKAYGSKEFTRIRIGLSNDVGEGKVEKPNVLGVFAQNELEVLAKETKEFSIMIETLAKEGKEKAMNMFN